MRRAALVASVLTLTGTLAIAQSQTPQNPSPQTPAAQPPKTPAPKPAGTTGTAAPATSPTGTGGRSTRTTAPAKTTSVRVTVRDAKGESLEGVRLILSGGAEGEYSTAGAGTAVLTDVKDGVYRLRLEHAGFITLEREFSVKATSALTPLDVVMTPAPAPPPPPPPVKAAPAVVPSGPPVSVNIPDYLDKNFIGRDPIKESILACKPAEIVRLLQLRDNVAEHVHDKVDEVLYVVAGEGSVRIGDQTITMKPGSLAVVPLGTAHAVERRGKNPLILLSTLSGATCPAGNKETQ
ncbi:MAG TPA: cupin domain-containing protein [Vicinamibacterales bacterium]